MVLIGGMAIAVHGITHVTEDLDVCYETSAPNCERLVRALAPLHPRPASAGLTDIALQEKK